jgi:hypothetical protein
VARSGRGLEPNWPGGFKASADSNVIQPWGLAAVLPYSQEALPRLSTPTHASKTRNETGMRRNITGEVQKRRLTRSWRSNDGRGSTAGGARKWQAETGLHRLCAGGNGSEEKRYRREQRRREAEKWRQRSHTQTYRNGTRTHKALSSAETFARWMNAAAVHSGRACLPAASLFFSVCKHKRDQSRPSAKFQS